MDSNEVSAYHKEEQEVLLQDGIQYEVKKITSSIEVIKENNKEYNKKVTVVSLKNKSDDYSRHCCLIRVMKLLMN